MNNTYKLYTDGSYSRTFNKGGLGGHLEDQNKNTIFQFSESYDDEKLKDKFEILAMEHGLKLAIEHNVKNILCHTDDFQLAAICNMKDSVYLQLYIDNNPSLKRVIDLLPQFDEINFAHLPRQYNKKADSNSRKYISEAKKEKILQKSNKDTSPEVKKTIEKVNSTSSGIFSAASFEHSSLYRADIKAAQEDFRHRKNGIEHIFMFNTSNTEQGVKLTAYLVHRNKKDISYNKICDQEIIGKPGKVIPEFINKILLNHLHLKKCVFFVSGDFYHHMNYIFRGDKKYASKNKGSYAQLASTMAQFESIIYNNESNIQNLIIPQVVKPKGEVTTDTLLAAMKILGQHDYKLGQQPEIENLIPVRDSKKDHVGGIQNVYFGEFMKLLIQAEKNYAPGEGRVVIKANPVNMKARFLKVKEELKQQGVNFHEELKFKV